MADLAFAIALEAVAARELFAAGNRRNYPLLAPVIVLAIANLLMHLQSLGVAIPVGLGWRLGIAAVIVLISVIGGRIVPAFTRNWLTARGVAAVPPPAGMLDRIALGTLHAGMIAWTFLPDWQPVGILLLVAAALNAARLGRWRGVATLAGTAAADPACRLSLAGGWRRAARAVAAHRAVPPPRAVHALTAGAMGTMILAVMTRATLGHTGRALHADAATIAIFALVTASAVLRIAAAWAIEAQVDLLEVSGLAWIGAFALFARAVRTDAVGAAQVTRQYCAVGNRGDADESDGVRGVRRSGSVGAARCARSAAAGPGEIQVRIEARGVQYVDVLMLAGKYQFRPDRRSFPAARRPAWCVAVGPGVTQFRAGDKVMSRHSLGACAELGNAKAALCDHVPDGMSLEAAGVFRGAYSTAYHALLQRGRMKAGEWVLVHGAAGGIGIAAIQVAKLFGAKVIATASTEEKRAPAWRKAPTTRSTTRAASSTR